MDTTMDKNQKLIAVVFIAVLLIGLGVAMMGNRSANNVTLPVISTSTIATIDYQLVMQKHPKMAEAQQKMQKSYEEIQKSMGGISSMPVAQQDTMIQEYQKKLQAQEKELFTPIKNDVDTHIKAIMTDKGYSAVADKRAIIQGGEDITVEVLVKEGLDVNAAKQAIEEASSSF